MRIENCVKIAAVIIFNIQYSIFNFSHAQTSDSLTKARIDSVDTSSKIIGDIIVIGNKITKENIITRELTFKKGDTILFTDFDYERIRSEQNIYNTALFNSVNITSVKKPEGLTDIYIILKERWYIFPVPIFEIKDRNFNVWWQTKDLSRVEYGGILNWNNFRGRNETLNLEARFGYTQSYSFSYSIPYITRKQTSGLNFRFLYARNHQTNYATYFNQPFYYKDENLFTRQLISGSVEYTYRKGLYETHYAAIGRVDAQIEDTIQKLNPDFFGGQKTTEKYFALRYVYKSEHRDYVYYPLKGYEYDIELVKNGLPITNDDIDFSYLTFTYRKYWQMAKRWYFATGLRGKISDNSFQPYYNTRALGYGGSFLRGYEYYVIDGQKFALLKTNLKFEILPKHEVHMGFIPFEKFATIPYAFYFNIYGDAAYVQDDQFYHTNTLTNSWLYGYGAGIDFVSYYDIVIRMEYSFNKFGESGFFLHFTAQI